MFPRFYHNSSTVGGSPFDGHRLPCSVTVSTEDGGIGALQSCARTTMTRHLGIFNKTPWSINPWSHFGVFVVDGT